MVALRRKKKDDEEKLSFCSRFSDNRNRRLVLATNEWEPFFTKNFPCGHGDSQLLCNYACLLLQLLC